MKIRFKSLIKTEAVLDVCDFSGACRRQIWEFDAGEELVIKKIIWGNYKKTKTRPGLKGGRFRHCELILTGPNQNMRHPDYLSGVPESAFEIIEE